LTLALGGLGLSLPAACLAFLTVALALEKKGPVPHLDFLFTEVTLLVGLVTLGLSLAVAFLARRDLAEIRAGRMAQTGERDTAMAFDCGRLSAVAAALTCGLASFSAFALY
jgi:ABC-type tungstate transport system substrate-binding protein